MLLVGAVLLGCTLSPELVSDGEVRFTAVTALLANQPIPPIKYSVIQPLLTLPIVLAAEPFGIALLRRLLGDAPAVVLDLLHAG